METNIATLFKIHHREGTFPIHIVQQQKHPDPLLMTTETQKCTTHSRRNTRSQGQWDLWPALKVPTATSAIVKMLKSNPPSSWNFQTLRGRSHSRPHYTTLILQFRDYTHPPSIPVPTEEYPNHWVKRHGCLPQSYTYFITDAVHPCSPQHTNPEPATTATPIHPSPPLP